MPVAVRLVEILTLVTILGILTGISITVLLLEKVIYLSLYLFGPLVQAIGLILYSSERLLIASLMNILNLTGDLGNSMQ